MSEPVELSAAIMVFNGVELIERCVESLAFCDEIVVVDDMSTDGTWELLQRLPVKARQHAHTTFAAQRALARDLSCGRWVLTIDADETITPELATRIREAIARPDAPDGFELCHRMPYPRGMEGHVWSWRPRLVRREKCRWIDTDSPHSPLDEAGLDLRRLGGRGEGWMEHIPLPSLPEALRKSINRSIILAAQGRARGKQPGVLRLFAASLYRFLKTWLTTGAWRHGRAGVLVSCLPAFETFTKYAFLLAPPPADDQALQDGGPGSYPAQSPLVSTELNDR
ncbi:MAG: glycosyltransferase family 2 protein [Deltaproteobacteria bacterium]|nr:glycosyltransferase family 2 protein [Deltaproteobacteria bacterium]